MNNIRVIVAVTIVSIVFVVAGCAPPATVDFVDIPRYLGTWYEIAKYPNAFQRDCIGETTATYEPHPEFPGDILVTNRCRQESPEGAFQEITGRARVVDETTQAKLSVSFFGPFGAPYWIIELDDAEGEQPYAWAVVSDPFRMFLWILSRTPTLGSETLESILDRIKAQGYDLDRLEWTPQVG